MVENIKEFAQVVADEIREYLPEEYEGAEIVLKDVRKNNDTLRTALCIKKKEENVSPALYLEGFYERYIDGQTLEDTLKQIAKAQVTADTDQIKVDEISKYDQIKDKIVPRLINAEKNKENLAERPHGELEDMAYVYAVNIGKVNGNTASYTITNQILENFGITKEELDQVAMENLSKEPISFKSMIETLIEKMGIPKEQEQMVFPGPDDGLMNILSNDSYFYGASAILDKATMRKISDQLGGDFIILPSSVHEVIILDINKMSDQMDGDFLTNMVQEVNATQVAPDEVLSDSVYIYDSKKERIRIFDSKELSASVTA